MYPLIPSSRKARPSCVPHSLARSLIRRFHPRPIHRKEVASCPEQPLLQGPNAPGIPSVRRFASCCRARRNVHRLDCWHRRSSPPNTAQPPPFSQLFYKVSHCTNFSATPALPPNVHLLVPAAASPAATRRPSSRASPRHLQRLSLGQVFARQRGESHGTWPSPASARGCAYFLRNAGSTSSPQPMHHAAFALRPASSRPATSAPRGPDPDNCPAATLRSHPWSPRNTFNRSRSFHLHLHFRLPSVEFYGVQQDISTLLEKWTPPGLPRHH